MKEKKLELKGLDLHFAPWVNLPHPSLEVVVSTGVRVHGSGQHFPQFDSKASRPIQVASNFEWPFLRKMAKLWLLSSCLN